MIPQGIVLHLSASNFGDRAQINQWHRDKGWSGIGYHFVVLNGKRNSRDTYKSELDGNVEAGRAENIKGAHCLANNMNTCTIGICSIGNPNQAVQGAPLAPSKFVTNTYLTQKQLNSLVDKAAQLCLKYGLNPAGSFRNPATGATHPVITQHSQHERAKPLCASLNIGEVRQAIISRFQSVSRDFDPELMASDTDNSVLADDPESVENGLPEFQYPLGSPEGPNDLEGDVPLDSQ